MQSSWSWGTYKTVENGSFLWYDNAEYFSEEYSMVNVCDIEVMKPLLAVHGFHFSKAKGQNFLIAPWVPESIARESGVEKDVGVLEIGPGIGPLTQQLSLRAGKVCAVEVDERLKPILDITLADCPNVEILWGDVLKQNIPALVNEKLGSLRPMACANLPYYITSPILTALLEAECFEAVTVMVQKEVAQRIAAQPGTEDYGAFSVFCQYYAQPELLFDVPPHCFLPQPKVTSAVVTLRVRQERPWDIDDPALFFRVVRASFAMRRKKLSNGLASGFSELGKRGAEEVLSACGFDANVRGETLGIPEFAAIARQIQRWRDSQ
jgi:16S rRNA (adenine1518-N6/adenine1519-N6)-dimethyltransferase